MDELGRDPRVLVGTPQGAHLPIAWETDELDPEQQQRDRWLAIDGVLDVFLVTLDFRDTDPRGLDATPLMRRGRTRRRFPDACGDGE